MNRELWALLLVASYALLCLFVTRRHRVRMAQAAADVAALLPSADAVQPMLVLHASQTGTAEALALQTARALHLAGLPVRLAALGEICPTDLQAATHALFIVATYGEGDAPDSAAAFTLPDADLKQLNFAVLALGDRSYQNFCGFGRALDDTLRGRGASALFERIEVDCEDEQALQAWRQRLSHLAGTADSIQFEAAPFAPWKLLARRHLNPGSQGGGVFHLELVPADGSRLPEWEAGDLAQIQLADDAAPREYTLASLPRNGHIALMVRASRRADGSPGRVSGCLTDSLALGASVDLRLRRHSSFRIGANAERPLILIGNGTGFAGLRAHLLAREASAGPPAWLVYGERQRTHDRPYADEIAAWRSAGLLLHTDLVFSRDGEASRYVQHLLEERAEQLADWVSKGAAIYVCGSLEGMAAGVDEVLRRHLSSTLVDGLIAQGRYRRDVY